MRRLLCLSALLVVVSVLRADNVDDFLRAEMDKHHIPGLVVAISRKGQEPRTSAYGKANLELNVPASVDTEFEIGSLTKQFTAACILLLVQDGRISVDERISKYLPETPQAWSNITVRHLLTHTSGIKSYTGLAGFELSRHLTQPQFIRALAPLPLEFVPGEQWKYCNSGYNLLGFIIENVSGRGYWDFLAGRVLGPLGMRSTTNRDPAILVLNRADGYKYRQGAFSNRDYDLTDVFSAGAIISTIGDLLKWNAALDQETLLSAASKQQMWTSARLNNGQECRYGFGWRIGEVNGHRDIGHSGSTSGFSASLQRFPDDGLALIMLCNSDEANIATTLTKQLAAMLLPRAGK